MAQSDELPEMELPTFANLLDSTLDRLETIPPDFTQSRLIKPQDRNRRTASATKVLNTTEILEMILLEASKERVFRLLTLQKVCTKFRDTIQGSIKLLQLVFLQPKSADQVAQEWSDFEFNLLPMTNPLFRHESELFFVPKLAIHHGKIIDAVALSWETGSQEELIEDVECEVVSEDPMTARIGLSTRTKKHLRCDDTMASWRNMIAVQVPATEEITLRISTDAFRRLRMRSEPKYNVYHYTFTGCFTLGVMADAVDQFYEQFLAKRSKVDIDLDVQIDLSPEDWVDLGRKRARGDFPYGEDLYSDESDSDESDTEDSDENDSDSSGSDGEDDG